MNGLPRTRTWRTALIGGVVAALILAGVTATALWRTDRTPAAATPSAMAPTDPAEWEVPEDAPSVAASDDPVTFARTVALTLFAWDTTDRRPVDAYRDPIIAVGDPAGIETPGLVADLGMYLPSVEAWEFLSGYSTRQWLDITAAAVPPTWPGIAANAPAGSLADGTTAVTIDGIRHRAGTWEGKPVHDEFAVAFTMFVVCGPTYPTCHLLRLGAPDTPMR